jgi:hypothetical protein
MVAAPGTPGKRRTFRSYLRSRGVKFTKNAHSSCDKKTNTSFYSRQLATLFTWWSNGRQGEMPVVDWAVGEQVYQERKADRKSGRSSVPTATAPNFVANSVTDRKSLSLTEGVRVTERVINSQSQMAAVEDSKTDVKREIVKQADGSTKIIEHETTKRRREEVKNEQKQIYEKSVESYTRRIATQEREQLTRASGSYVKDMVYRKQREYKRVVEEHKRTRVDGMFSHLELTLKEALPKIKEDLEEIHTDFTLKEADDHSMMWDRFTPQEYLDDPMRVVEVLNARAEFAQYMYPQLKSLYSSCAEFVTIACKELALERQGWAYGLKSLRHDPALDAQFEKPGGYEEYKKNWRYTVDVLCLLPTCDPRWVDMGEFTRKNPCPGEIESVVGRANKFVKEDKRKLADIKKDRKLGGFTPAEVERLCAKGSTPRIRLQLVLDIDNRKLDRLVGYVAGIHTMMRTVLQGKIPDDLKEFEFMVGCEIRDGNNIRNQLAYEPRELFKSRRGTEEMMNFLCVEAQIEDPDDYQEPMYSDEEEEDPAIIMQLDARLLYNMFPGGDSRERLDKITQELLKRKSKALTIPNGYEPSRVVVSGTRTRKAITLPLRLMDEPEFTSMALRLQEEETKERAERELIYEKRRRLDPNRVMRNYFRNVDAPGAADNFIDALGDPSMRMPTMDEVAKAW